MPNKVLGRDRSGMLLLEFGGSRVTTSKDVNKHTERVLLVLLVTEPVARTCLGPGAHRTQHQHR